LRIPASTSVVVQKCAEAAHKKENLAPVSKFAFKSITPIMLIPVICYLITNNGEYIYKLTSLFLCNYFSQVASTKRFIVFSLVIF